MFATNVQAPSSGFRKAWLVDLAALAVSLGWFAHNATQSPAYSGRLCCDSTDYLAHARFPFWFEALQCQHHPMGYPFFLRAHLLLHDALGLPASPDWITLSCVSAFVLGVGSVYAFYRALWHRNVRVPRVALWLLLLHPGLAAYAASPLTDSLTLSMLLILFACVLRFEWEVRLRSLLMAAGIGALLGAVVLTRTSHYLSAVAFLTGFAIVGIALAARRRAVAMLLLPLLSLVCFERTTAPRRAACSGFGGTYRVLGDLDTERFVRESVERGRTGARDYLLVLQDPPPGKRRFQQIIVPDPFIQEHFDCLPTRDTSGPVLTNVLACFRDRAPFLPGLFTKKTIALFDISHLNPHAAETTTPVERWWNRLFGAVAFAGLTCLGIVATWAATRRRLPLQIVLVLVYLGTCFAGSLITHVEARYGLPLIPAVFMSFALVAREALETGWKRWAIVAVLGVAAGVFVTQTVMWDQVDRGIPPVATPNPAAPAGAPSGPSRSVPPAR